MASVVVKRGCLHCGPGKVGILVPTVSTYCRACRPYFLADFHQTQTILKRVTSTLRWVEWKVAHGPTTWPPLWLSEAVFITDRAYNAGAKLEFLVSTYCRACRPYFLADFHQTQTILKRVTSTLRWVEWKVAHGPTTWPPLWLSEAAFITDRAYNAGAKLEFGPYASNYLITGLACLAIYCFMYM